jgi:hypothetical protein
MVFDLLEYMTEVANISENPKTLENILDIVNSLLDKYPSQMETIANKVLHPILNFMLQKPKIRVPVIILLIKNLCNLQILDKITSNQYYIDNLKEKEKIDLISPIISVLTKHQYSSTSILQVINLASPQYEDEKVNKKVENEISQKGVILLERLVDINELKRMVKLLKDSVNTLIHLDIRQKHSII